jgi:hypothetical protein
MSQDKGPNFWDTKEGTLGMAVALMLAGGGLYGLYKILPFLVSLTTNLLKLGMMVGVISILFYALVLDDSLRKFLGLRYKLLMKAMLYSVIERDPCQMLRLTRDEEHKRLDEIDDAMGTARGSINVLRKTMEGYQERAKRIDREYQQLKKDGADPVNLQSKSIMLGELNEAFQQMKGPYERVTRIFEGFTEARKYTAAKLERMDFKIELETEKYKAMSSLTSVVSLFKGVLTGRDEMAQMQQATFDFMDEDNAKKAGAIDQFLEDSKKIFDDANLQNRIMSADGQALLEDLDRRRLEILGGTPEPVAVGINQFSTSKYSKYLTKE